MTGDQFDVSESVSSGHVGYALLYAISLRRCRMDKIYIECIGIDERLHVCEPNLDVCKCGIAVKSKKLNRDDYLRYSCYECTY